MGQSRNILKSVLLCCTAALCGCESPGPGGNTDPFAWLKPNAKQTTETRTTSSSHLPPADSALNRLTGTDNGLAIRKWIIADDEERIRTVLMRHAEGGVVHDAADERLRRNGFRLIQVDAGELETLLAELGGASLDVTAWHGQVYNWRSVASHGIGRYGQPLAIDGHVRQYPAGEMQLVMRSWIVAMEDGPYLQFELVPQFHRPQRTDVNLLLGREPPEPIESYPSMAVDQLLDADSAYLLTCAPPQSPWTMSQESDNAVDSTESQPFRRRGSSVGPSEFVGPEAAPPQTIGQWMLSNDIGRPNRIVLVLLPRISDRLYPPSLSQAPAEYGE